MSVCIFTNCPAPDKVERGRCLGCNSLVLGEKVGDRYVVWEVKGVTKYSITYLVTDSKSGDEERLLKELQPISEDDPDYRSKSRATVERLFQREASVLMGLVHPGIPRLYSVFEDGSYWYLVQEYIPGKSLFELSETTPEPIQESEARFVLRELAVILHYIHSQEPPVIHRDIKPSNLLRSDKDHRLLLTNFGSLSLGDQKSNRTVVGSAGYAPPEQLLGVAVPQSDLFAAGATMLRLMTKMHPSKLYIPSERRFDWQSQAQVTPSFAEVINGLLAHDLAGRTSSAEVLLEQLDMLRPLF